MVETLQYLLYNYFVLEVPCKAMPGWVDRWVEEAFGERSAMNCEQFPFQCLLDSFPLLGSPRKPLLLGRVDRTPKI